jgi:hypothetical protein
VYGVRNSEREMIQRRHVVVVHACAQERQLVVGGDVPRRQLAQAREHLLLRQPLGKVDRPAEPDALRQGGEQLVDRLDADALEHRLPVGVGGGGVAAQDSEPS